MLMRATSIGFTMAGLSLAARSALAQTGCVVTPASLGSGADACAKANDLFRFIVPQIGVAVSAGNPVPGEGGTMGGFGKRAVSVRLVGVEGRLPKNSVPINLAGAAVQSDFGASRTIIPLPSADAAIGIAEGIPLGLTNIGGVDLLLGATALPKVSQGALRLDPKGDFAVAFSYGVRVGALQESSFVPGISVSYMIRKLPTVDFTYTPGNDTLQVTGTSVRSNSIRIVASKRLLLFGLAAGVGRDQISASSAVKAVINDAVSGGNQRGALSLPFLAEKVSRNNAFVNASFSVLVTRVVAEFGWSASGPARTLLNSFGGRSANEGYRYGSLGLTTRF